MSETDNIEYKPEWKDDFLKVICAFANTGGGTLYIGKDDKGEVLGVQNFKELLEQLPNKINNKLGIIAPVYYHKGNGGNILSAN